MDKTFCDYCGKEMDNVVVVKPPKKWRSRCKDRSAEVTLPQIQGYLSESFDEAFDCCVKCFLELIKGKRAK